MTQTRKILIDVANLSELDDAIKGKFILPREMGNGGAMEIASGLKNPVLKIPDLDADFLTIVLTVHTV